MTRLALFGAPTRQRTARILAKASLHYRKKNDTVCFVLQPATKGLRHP